MTSEKLQKARNYEAHFGQYITPEERPGFHLSSYVGWMNDPNGFCFYNGKYHQFYQYHPYSALWGPMHWGHAVSEDLVKWEFLPCAIAPDMAYDAGGCFSGSAAQLPDGRMLLMYTGVDRSQREDGTWNDIQTQCLAVGDGIDFEKVPGNPVLSGKDLPENFSRADFRDPKLWQEPDGSFACVAANRTDDGSGSVLLFRSPDGFSWHFDSIVERCYNEFGKMWECPDFFSLDGKKVLLTSPMDMSPIGLEFHNGNGNLCLIGTEENGAFQREAAQAIDYGIDFYATQTLLAPDGRRIMTAWMQNWDTIYGHGDKAKWFGQMVLPRELHIVDNRLIQKPIREIEAYRGRRVCFKRVAVCEETSLNNVYGRLVDMTLSITPRGNELYRLFKLKVASGSQHYTSITYCPQTSTLRVNRTHSGSCRDFIHTRNCMVRDQGGKIKLRVLIDRFSVEVFVNDGEQALTLTINTPLSADGICFDAEGSLLLDVDKYDLKL